MKSILYCSNTNYDKLFLKTNFNFPPLHVVNDRVTELLAMLTVVPNTKTTPKYGATNC